MKKLLSLISAAAFLLSTAACQQEIEQVENPADETVEVTINVSVPDGLKTKAMGDASTLTKVNYEIWDSEWTEIVEKNVIELDENLKGTLALKLIRFKTYNVLFWAQGEAAKHTWTDLREINIDYTPNIENDAFAGRVLGIDATNDKNLENAVVLKRPFAQINFATDDLGAGKGVNMGDLAFKSAKVTVPGLAKKYNNVDGVAAGAAEAVTFESTALMAEPFVMNEVSYDYVLVFYPLVGEGEKTTVNLAADFVATCGEEEVAVSWTGKGAMNNVPVQANYRTNFFGSIYTAFGDIDVSVDDEFTDVVEPDLNIDSKTIAELLDEATAAGTYLIEGNVTAVAVNATDDTKEDVTIKDASGAELTLTLAKDAAEIVVKAVDTYYHVGDKVKVIVEKTADGVVASDIMNHVRDIAVADGSYWITYDGKYMYPGNEKVTYYYGKLEAAGYKDNAFAFKAVNGGYTIQDSYGRYLYQSGTFTSFNVAAELPEAGAVWGVAEAEGGYVLTNGEYYVRFSSYGSLDLTKTEADAAVVGLADATEAKERPVLTLSKKTDSVEAETVEYTLTITSNVAWTAKASEGVTLDKTSGEGNGTVVLTFAANTAATPVEHTVTVTAEGVDAQTLTLTQAAKPTDLAPDTFETLPFKSATMGDFTINDVELGGLSYVWKEDTSNKYMKANAYLSGTDYTTESWIVSPWFDLTSATKAYVSFSHCANYFNGATPESMLGVYVKEFGGEWTALEIDNWPTGKNWNWYDVELELASSFVGKYVQVGVKYTSDAEVEAGTYEIKSFRIAETEKPYVTVSDSKLSVAADATSVTFEVESNCEWTVTSDNADFTPSVSGNIVTVSFAANTTTSAKTANITVTGDEDTSVKVTITQDGLADATKLILDLTKQNQTNISSYTSSFDHTVGGNTWTLNAMSNNNNGWTNVRFGRKSEASTASIVTKTPIADKVSSVVVDFTTRDAKTEYLAFLTSATLVVASDADFANVVETVTVTPTIGNLTYTVATPTSNCYYKLEYVCASTGQNGCFFINTVTYNYTK